MSLSHARLVISCLALAGLSGAAWAAAPVPAAAPAAAPAPAPAPAAAPAVTTNPAVPQFSVNQNVGDWVVRCVETSVKSPAPCEALQATVNKDTQQRLSSFSIAFIPSRDTYLMQIVVPTGVALAKGLTLGTTLNGVRFNRCEREGCFVETVIDAAGVTALGAGDKATTIGVYGYGNNNEIKIPVSLTGFPEAIDRVKSFARTRAIDLPANSPLLPPVGNVAPAAPR